MRAKLQAFLTEGLGATHPEATVLVSEIISDADPVMRISWDLAALTDEDKLRATKLLGSLLIRACITLEIPETVRFQLASQNPV